MFTQKFRSSGSVLRIAAVTALVAWGTANPVSSKSLWGLARGLMERRWLGLLCIGQQGDSPLPCTLQSRRG